MKVFGKYLEITDRIRRENNPRYDSCPMAKIIGQSWSTGDEPPLYVECKLTKRECLGICRGRYLSHRI